LAFVLPGHNDLPTGGNLFNRHLLAALRARGLSIREVDSAAFAAHPPSKTAFVDSLLLDALHDYLPVAPPSPSLFLILHLLPSMLHDLPKPVRLRLLDRERFVLTRLNGVLVTSDFSRDYLTRVHHFTKPILVVRPALVITPGGARASREGFHGLIVSNLVRSKGLREFLGAFGEELLPRDKLELVIAGRADMEPDYAQSCLRLIRERPSLSSRVRHAGAMQPEQLQMLYSQSTVFISAAPMETYGMALAEARAFGLPILACNGGNVRAHVDHGINGWLWDSPQELAQACVRLSRRQEELQWLAAGALSRIPQDHYTWDNAATSFITQLRAAQT
jgi:glycosyltransferase involved in cell wall biosynthesis